MTAADWLSLLGERLGPPLMPQEARARLEPLARRLPGSCQVALEIHLGDPLEWRRVDLAARVRTVEEAGWLGRQVRSHVTAAALTAWAVSAGLRARAPELWLELDVPPEPAAGGGTGAPEPFEHPVLCARLAPRLEPRWITDRLLPTLLGAAASGTGEVHLETGQRRGLLTALERLPPPARPLYVFSLSERGEAREGVTGAVRLEVIGIPRGALPSYLVSVGAPAAADRVEAVGPLLEKGARTHLSLDFVPGATGPGDRVGLEISFLRLPRREPGWRRLFEGLRQRGLCSEAEARAALDWPGQDSFWTAEGHWPAVAGAGYCVRSLSHVKLITRPGCEPKAKLYLLFGLLRPAPRDREG